MQAITFIRLESQRLPNKAILPINGIPMCNYLVETMTEVSGVDEVIVYSSEDYMKDSGINYRYIKRDKVLDGDVDFNILMTSALPHITSEYVLFFCVTSPFLKRETIEDMVDAVKTRNYDSAMPVISIKNFCWHKGKTLNYNLEEDIPWTQNLDPVYEETSGLYIFTKSLFENYNRRIGFSPYLKEIDPIEGHDIDYQHELDLARCLVDAKLV